MSEWQLIETAPKDGEKILIYSKADGVISSHFEGGLWQGQPWRTASDRKKSMPTHWMPLPDPPTGA